MSGLAACLRDILYEVAIFPSDQPQWHPIDQAAGPPSVKPVDPAEVENARKEAYLSYENFLRQSLQNLDRQLDKRWARDYSSLQAYERSRQTSRQRHTQMLGF